MCVRNFSFVVSFVYIINAQIALPTFQAVHKPHNISSSTAVGAVIAADLYHMGANLANGTVKFWSYNGLRGNSARVIIHKQVMVQMRWVTIFPR